MQINLDDLIQPVDIMALLIKSHNAKQACLAKRGEIPTDIVADMLNADGVDISIEHYQFFLSYADYDHLDEQVAKPEARESSHIANAILLSFAENLYREWQAFQEFDVNNEHLGFLESVNEFFQEKHNKYLDSLFADMQKT